MKFGLNVAPIGDKVRAPFKKRRLAVGIIGLGMLAPFAACGRAKKRAKSEVTLAVVVHSYIDRPILDIFFNGTDLGLSGAFGGTGTITGVRVPYGVQELTWRLDGSRGMPRLGETVTARNQLFVRQDNITPETRYVGVHLYQDETAELTFSDSIPPLSERGIRVFERSGG